MSVARFGSMRLDDSTALCRGVWRNAGALKLNALMGWAPSGRSMLRSDHIA